MSKNQRPTTAVSIPVSQEKADELAARFDAYATACDSYKLMVDTQATAGATLHAGVDKLSRYNDCVSIFDAIMAEIGARS